VGGCRGGSAVCSGGYDGVDVRGIRALEVINQSHCLNRLWPDHFGCNGLGDTRDGCFDFHLSLLNVGVLHG
jgi:hypothetical protein